MRLTFIKGIVAPPRHIVVNKTTINVLATITNFVFVENFYKQIFVYSEKKN
jgi:hypothetical protein